MSFIEDLKNLDINDIGRWPLPIQAFFMVLFFFIATAGAFWFFVWQNQMPRLEKAQAEEKELRITFESKQKKAANFSAYKAQLAEIERSFGTMLRQLPGKTEIPEPAGGYLPDGPRRRPAGGAVPADGGGRARTSTRRSRSRSACPARTTSSASS